MIAYSQRCFYVPIPEGAVVVKVRRGLQASREASLGTARAHGAVEYTERL